MATIKIHQVTYQGARAEVKEIREAGAHGEREVRIRWIDQATPANGSYPAGTVTSHTVTGNPLKGTFQTLIAKHVVQEF